MNDLKNIWARRPCPNEIFRAALWLRGNCPGWLQHKTDLKLFALPLVYGETELSNVTLLHLGLVVVRIGCPISRQRRTATRSGMKKIMCPSWKGQVAAAMCMDRTFII